VTSISTGYTAFKGRRSLAPAALACMGIVFGDIGTSPLYTLQVAVRAASPSGAISSEAVIGIVSLIFWSLIIVISIKYAILIMRASNHGEGGILALLALISLGESALCSGYAIRAQQRRDRLRIGWEIGVEIGRRQRSCDVDRLSCHRSRVRNRPRNAAERRFKH
jgi:K+ potassium transporter